LETEQRDNFPNRYEWVAIVCAILPFFLYFGAMDSRSGEPIPLTVDAADVLIGGFLLWQVWRNFMDIRRGATKEPTIHIALNAVLLLTALFHIVNGLDLLAG
jgi:hypothetical protein